MEFFRTILALALIGLVAVTLPTVFAGKNKIKVSGSDYQIDEVKIKIQRVEALLQRNQQLQSELQQMLENACTSLLSQNGPTENASSSGSVSYEVDEVDEVIDVAVMARLIKDVRMKNVHSLCDYLLTQKKKSSRTKVLNEIEKVSGVMDPETKGKFDHLRLVSDNLVGWK
ncbi:uncharacterized protein LOC116347767 [Contarinia nasturtii]|uniref:uncharacterized protein LOC116347767 n=1 Tax=Contarinia nasturtii TaxID=265458 RepID=UPI0012D38E7B|nr:uncharacterized protein LOC116347767 [Contarinia nasturtii]